jgi:RNA polymerase sigma factor (sigma-70 family)
MDMNTKIEQAMRNPDIIKIMNKASRSFCNDLDKDTIHTCHINALWKCFVNFKPEFNTKFTTYLYKGVVIECIKEKKFKSKSAKHKIIHNNIHAKSSNNLLGEILEYLDTEEEKSILLDRFSNFTIQEIAEKRGYSRETARKRLKKVYQKIKMNFK